MTDSGSHPRAGREAILVALRQATGPASAHDLGDVLGLHPNTVRGHLELLVNLGYATRVAEERTERGRPRVLYTPVEVGERSFEAYRSLAAALMAELSAVGSTADQGAVSGGAAWARSLVASGKLRQVHDPDAAVAQVAELLGELGFGVATEPLGDRIYLSNCPYADLAGQLPQTCALHRHLLQAVFAEVGGGVTVEDVVRDARPGICLVRLHRTDLTPGANIGAGPVQQDQGWQGPGTSRRVGPRSASDGRTNGVGHG